MCNSSVYLGLGVEHHRDSLRMLTWAKKTVETRDIISEVPAVMVVPPVHLQQSASLELARVPELGGTSQPGRASEPRKPAEPGGLDDSGSTQSTPDTATGEKYLVRLEYHPWRRVQTMVVRMREVCRP